MRSAALVLAALLVAGPAFAEDSDPAPAAPQSLESPQPQPQPEADESAKPPAQTVSAPGVPPAPSPGQRAR